MFFTLIIFNIALIALVIVYCKLTCGYCKSSKHLVGKVVIVTGANSGIGFETAKDLAERGARVILACRSEERGTTARNQIIAFTRNKDVHYQHLDLASLKSVRTFAESVLKNEKQLHILINNSGIGEADNVKTEDGLLLAMQTNHFGPFLLTVLLLPLLKTSAPSRIINVSSKAHKHGEIDFENLNAEKETEKTFSRIKVYGNTKLCNILTSVELARQLSGTGVTVNSLHPGVVLTEILFKIKSRLVQWVLPLVAGVIKTPWQGAQTSIYLAVSPEVEGITGKYFSDCRLGAVSKTAQDQNIARKLWEVSERIVKL